LKKLLLGPNVKKINKNKNSHKNCKLWSKD